MLVVLANEREDFVYSPAGFRMLVENRQKLSDTHPWPVELICTDASSHGARKCRLEVVCVRLPPHFGQVVLTVLLEVGERELIIEVRVGAEHFIEALSSKPDLQIAGHPQTSCP